MTESPVPRLNAALEGRYHIERELGEGGMATVYLADDLKHERKVALKVLKPELAAVVGAERFLAEIKTTANLQHPHILPLHDSGEADGFLYFVMPYVEGETLHDRLAREKQLPVKEALRIATAIANALQTAHEAGVVHRDIKPGNILLSRGEPLVADFGISLAVGGASGARLTETGLSIGTPYYMSPEQATGDQAVGPSSDVFALACVLYEMLVGEPPYPGTTAQAVLGRIIQGAPVSATAIRQTVPRNVDAAIRRALERLPADRFADATEFAKALADPGFRHGEAPTAMHAGGRGWRMAAYAFAATTAALAVLSGWLAMRSEPPRAPHRTSIVLPQPRGGFLGSMALSPDGSVLVYEGPAAEASDPPLLWVRRWSELDARPIEGSDVGAHPSVSPDGQQVVFVSGTSAPRTLMIASLSGGVPRVLADDALSDPHWGTDDYVYYTDRDTNGLSRVPATGGTKEMITEPAEGSQGTAHREAFYIDGAHAVLFITFAPGGPQILVADVETGEVRPTGLTGLRPHYSPTGHVVYVAPTGEITAAPFDTRSLEVTGLSVPVVGGASYEINHTPLALSPSGTLIYPTGAGSTQFTPVWVGRDGAMTAIDPNWTLDPGSNNRGFSLSPDGRYIAVGIEGDLPEDIWIKELPRGPLTRLTVDSAQDVRPRWTRDGRVTYVSEREGRLASVYAQRADGTGQPELLLTHELPLWEGIVSGDGRWLLARTGGTLGAIGGRDILALELGVEAEPRALVVSGFDEKAIALSPDGRWLAYESDETGRNEVYVRPFPDVEGGKWAVSTEGGVMPVWSRDGSEIFYVDSRTRMVSAEVSGGGDFVVENRQTLFTVGSDMLIGQAEQYSLYDVHPDGQRFLMLQQSAVVVPELILVQNFSQDLRERLLR